MKSGESALRPGVRLICCQPDGLLEEGPIQCSSGIVPGQVQYREQEHLYWSRSFVPKLPWRRPTASEYDLLLGSPGQTDSGMWLQVFRPPTAVYDRFEELRRYSREGTEDDLRRYIAGEHCQEALNHTIEYARSLTWPQDKPLEGAGIFYKDPQLPTSTPHKSTPNKRPLLLGIHFDTWYNVPIGQRCYSPIRLSINLGLCDRYFVFVNQGMSQIERMLIQNQVAFQDDPESPTHALRTAFYQAFSHYPVIKLRIRPGEAYIAPTENVIHDASTLGQTSYDVQFAVRGHFRYQTGDSN